jgi:iron complex outermembrane receptor protein
MKKSHLLSYTFLAASVLAPVSAFAQAEEEQGVVDIVVTAQRRSESLMSVPVAVSAIGNEDLARQGIANSLDLSGAVPSLQVTSAFGNAQPNFTMRGIGVGNEYGANQVSPVGIYTDDNYLSARTMHGLQLFDLERVEAVRGPQGTLYGRNTTGGAINFISVKPKLEGGTTGFVEAGYGRFNAVTAQGAIEGTLIDDKLGFRASVNYDHARGYVKNIYPGQPDANSRDSLAGRLIIRAKPTDKLDITLKLTAATSDPTQAAAFHRNDGSGVSTYHREDDGLSFYETNQPSMGRSKVKNKGVQLNVNLELTDSLSLQTLTAYDRAKQGLTQEGSGTPVVGFLQTNYVDTYNQFNQEIKLSYDSDRTKVQGGVYYGWDKINNVDRYRLVKSLYIYQHYKQVRKSAAIFLQVDQNLTGQLVATLGVRYTKDKSKHYDAYSFITGIDPAVAPDFFAYEFDPTAPGTGFTHGSISPDGVITPEAAKRRKSNRLTGKAGLSYKFDSGALIFANYSRGYRAGSFSSQFFASPIDFVSPEKVNAFEVGAKGRVLDGRLALSGAAFLTKYKNQQLNEVIGTTGYIRSVPGSEIKGVEFEANGRWSSSLKTNFAITYLDAKYEKLTLSGVVLDGNTLPNAPKLTVNAGFDWTVGKLGNGNIVFSPNVIYTSKQYFSPFNKKDGNQYLVGKENAKVNVSLGWEGEQLGVRAFVNNLTNVKMFNYGLNLRGSFGYDYMLHAPPRTYGVSAKYKF